MTEDEERAAVVAEARTWLRTPYHHRAWIKGAGVDCAMLPLAVYRAAVPHRVPPVTVPSYPRDWHLHKDTTLYRDIVAQIAHPIAEEALKPGDFIMYRFGRAHAHGGIYIDEATIIHAQIGQGVTTQEIWAGWLTSRDPEFWSLW